VRLPVIQVSCLQYSKQSPEVFRHGESTRQRKGSGMAAIKICEASSLTKGHVACVARKPRTKQLAICANDQISLPIRLAMRSTLSN
jgi:hypothetical protein